VQSVLLNNQSKLVPAVLSLDRVQEAKAVGCQVYLDWGAEDANYISDVYLASLGDNVTVTPTGRIIKICTALSNSSCVEIPEQTVTLNLSLFTLTGDVVPSCINVLKNIRDVTPDEVAVSSSSGKVVIDSSPCEGCKSLHYSEMSVANEPASEVPANAVCPTLDCTCAVAALQTFTMTFTVLPMAKYTIIVGRPDMRLYDLTRLLRYHFVGDMCVCVLNRLFRPLAHYPI
jgi:hypothetical protein